MALAAAYATLAYVRASTPRPAALALVGAATLLQGAGIALSMAVPSPLLAQYATTRTMGRVMAFATPAPSAASSARCARRSAGGGDGERQGVAVARAAGNAVDSRELDVALAAVRRCSTSPPMPSRAPPPPPPRRACVRLATQVTLSLLFGLDPVAPLLLTAGCCLLGAASYMAVHVAEQRRAAPPATPASAGRNLGGLDSGGGGERSGYRTI